MPWLEIAILVVGTLSLGGLLKIMVDLSKVQAAVATDTSATQSAITLMIMLSAAIREANASGDQASVDALADQISANAAALGAAVTANTPAAPAGNPVLPPIEVPPPDAGTPGN